MKLKETYDVTNNGMQIWWHGTTDQEFKHIHAPSFKTPFFISNDPEEATIYASSMFSSKQGKICLIVINPKVLNIFDWCNKEDLNTIQTIPNIIKDILVLKNRSCFLITTEMCEYGLFNNVIDNDFNTFKTYFNQWNHWVKNVSAQDIYDVFNWLKKCKSLKDLYDVYDFSSDGADNPIANNVIYELFYSQLEGTNFNAFHEKETSDNIALCDISAIEGIWSKCFSIQEVNKLINSSLEIRQNLMHAKTSSEVESALKIYYAAEKDQNTNT